MTEYQRSGRQRDHCVPLRSSTDSNQLLFLLLPPISLRVNYPNPKGKVAPINENNYKGGGGGDLGNLQKNSNILWMSALMANVCFSSFLGDYSLRN